MSGPHQNQSLVTAGAPLRAADAAAVLVHGRGATADSVVRLADEFYRHGLALLAPQAERNRWYPNSFLAPVESNEPWLSSGLQAIDDAVAEANGAGISTDRILLFGVSQGACLVSEFAARDPTRYGGLVAASGGLVGPDIDTDQYRGERSLDGTPVLVSGTAEDPHVPAKRLRETATVFERLGGDVTERIDEGDGHGVSDADLAAAGERLTSLLEGEPERRAPERGSP
ncbi:phospholipase/carboxylesterase [Halomicrobium zhouii]|uniref:Phospholipase/carboxylesterase n=1 Tax=Halomicrobium zhouii TaxID=767519 RepID=A0A1I6KYZ6_9EURY|nr:phospholipase [Halomicrobium zhouii]SFR96424.1 phospholipase/carboxylesterase [Halomicrobium zhouii]